MTLFTVYVIDRDFEEYKYLLEPMFQQRYEIYCEEHEFARGDDAHKVEQDEYDKNKHCVYFLCFYDHDLVASSRLIINSSIITLPIIEANFELYDQYKKMHESSVEAGRLIIKKDLRNHPVNYYTFVLASHMFLYVLMRNIRYCYAMMEEPVFFFLKDVVGLPFVEIGEPKYFMGGVLLPTRVEVMRIRFFSEKTNLEGDSDV